MYQHDIYPSITFKNNPSLCPAQRHWRLVSDSKLMYNQHFLSRFNKSIELLTKFQPVLPRSSLLTI